MSNVIHLFTKTLIVDSETFSSLIIPLTNDDMRDNEANTLQSEDAFIRSTYLKPKSKARTQVGGLKYYPKLKQWKASNVRLHEDTLEAYSYDWWRFLEKIGPYLVFNDYRYSPSTSKHQSKVRSWLWHNRLDSISIESPRGLQDLDGAIRHYERAIQVLRDAIKRPKSKHAKNKERLQQIRNHEDKIDLIKELLAKQRDTA